MSRLLSELTIKNKRTEKYELLLYQIAKKTARSLLSFAKFVTDEQ